MALCWQEGIARSPGAPPALAPRARPPRPPHAPAAARRRQATNHLGRRSFFTTADEDQWALVRKGTAAAFSLANIRRAARHRRGAGAAPAAARCSRAHPAPRAGRRAPDALRLSVQACETASPSPSPLPRRRRPRRRYFIVALKHAQELAGQVKLAAAGNPRGVEMQEQVGVAAARGEGQGRGGVAPELPRLDFSRLRRTRRPRARQGARAVLR